MNQDYSCKYRKGQGKCLRGLKMGGRYQNHSRLRKFLNPTSDFEFDKLTWSWAFFFYIKKL